MIKEAFNYAIDDIGLDFPMFTCLMGIDSAAPAFDWIGMKVKPRFLRNSKLKPMDEHFIPKTE